MAHSVIDAVCGAGENIQQSIHFLYKSVPGMRKLSVVGWLPPHHHRLAASKLFIVFVSRIHAMPRADRQALGNSYIIMIIIFII